MDGAGWSAASRRAGGVRTRASRRAGGAYKPSSSILAIQAALGYAPSAKPYHACTLAGLCHFLQSLLATNTTSPNCLASSAMAARAQGTSPATQRTVACSCASGSHVARAAMRYAALFGTTMMPMARVSAPMPLAEAARGPAWLVMCEIGSPTKGSEPTGEFGARERCGVSIKKKEKQPMRRVPRE